MYFRCTSALPTYRAVGNGFVVLRPLTSAVGQPLQRFCSSPCSFGETASGWRCDKPGVYAYGRRLPPRGLSPPRSCLRLELLLCHITLGILPYDKVPILFRGLVCQKANDTPQVHAHVGRTDAREVRLARGFEVDDRWFRLGDHGRYLAYSRLKSHD